MTAAVVKTEPICVSAPGFSSAYCYTKPSPAKQFICVYPIYINSKKTLAEGRRIPTEKAVENPSCAEVRDVLTAAGMNVYVENKMHPREWNRDVQFRGRVRVQLKQTDGSLCQDKFRSRKFPAGGASPGFSSPAAQKLKL
uniref:Signal recognition particle 19 kDa protein n=1 Tax=Xiphophorus couchianus TaxID=32473 RepID=A0A3B5LZK5_9TELE